MRPKRKEGEQQVKLAPPMINTQQMKTVAPSFKKTPQATNSCQEKMVLLAKPTNEMLSPMKFFES
jgi:hypothetical protein